MGGDLSVSSEHGKGSTFTLTFEADRIAQPAPVAQLTPALPSAGGPASTNIRGKRVLLVDDNRINRQVARLFLAPLGVSITEAANGQEALEALAQADFDVVLLDIHMPVMDGPTTIARIRASDQKWKHVPVIALTADAMAGDAEKYLAMGMSAYVSKPINQRELEQQLAAMLLGPRRFAA
jgi:CheY-like chemotaxis protein